MGKLNEWVKERKELLQLIILLFTGVLISGIIGIAQICSSNNIAKSQQRLFALQTFSNRLTGDRLTREMTLRVIDNLNDKDLSDSLREISNRITIEMLKDSIWNDSSSVRENAIIEYAQLYNHKEYQSEILDALMPRYYHLENWNPLISIAKFFYYLEIYSDSTWYGTKKDSLRFATIKKSKYYQHPELAPVAVGHNNLRRYINICLQNFKLDTTLNYRGTHLGNLIWNNYENDDESQQ